MQHCTHHTANGCFCVDVRPTQEALAHTHLPIKPSKVILDDDDCYMSESEHASLVEAGW